MTEERLLFDFVLYGCLPFWVVTGFIDWYCHKKTHIEQTSGVRESFYHALMGVQVGLPIMLGLYFEINVLHFLIMTGVLIFHEWAAHHDVKYARDLRHISMTEVHMHSFLEVLPWMIVSLVVIMNWPAFLDFITGHWAGNMGLATKKEPISTTFRTGYFIFMMIIGVVPYVEEMWRCWTWQRQHAKESA